MSKIDMEVCMLWTIDFFYDHHDFFVALNSNEGSFQNDDYQKLEFLQPFRISIEMFRNISLGCHTASDPLLDVIIKCLQKKVELFFLTHLIESRMLRTKRK